MKKLTILCLHLGFGGIEKCISSFANAMCNYYDITIVSTYRLYKCPAYHIDSRVKIVYLIDDDIAIRVDQYKKLYRNHKIGTLFKVLNKDYINKGHIIKLFKDTFTSIKVVKEKKELMINYLKNMDTDVVLSTRLELNELVSNYVGNNIYKVAWEHNHGDMEYIKNVICSASNMNLIVLVSKELYEIYSKNSNVKCIYIPNVIDNMPNTIAKLDNYNIISVGRLEKEKGQLDLIDVIDKVYRSNNKVRLTLIGDGDEKGNLTKKIKSKNLQDVISLTGYKDSDYIGKALYDSSIFLLTSYTESFGIVLIEAMSHGVPCISFTSAEGANEIIEDGKNGYLVSNRDIDAMSKLILDLLKNRSKLKDLGKNAYNTSLKYTKDIVYDEWIKVIDNV